MQNQVYFLNQNLAFLLIITVSLLFAVMESYTQENIKVYQIILPRVEMLEQHP